MIELVTGQMISGAGRLAAGAAQLVLLGLGILAAAALVGVPAIEVADAPRPLGPAGPWIAVAVFGLGIVMNQCARPTSLGWILLVLYVAYGAKVLGGLAFGGVLSAFVGAAAMTPAAALVAKQRTGPPMIVSFTPAFWLLVPGALGLVGVAALLHGDDSGMSIVTSTVETLVAIALGVLVGRALSRVRPRPTRRPRRPPPAQSRVSPRRPGKSGRQRLGLQLVELGLRDCARVEQRLRRGDLVGGAGSLRSRLRAGH